MKHIEQCVFNNCYSLSSITLPSTLTYLGSFAFQYCLALKEVTVPESVQFMGHQIFLECRSLTSVTLPSTITNIDHNMFRRCTALEQIIIGGKKVKKYPFKVNYTIMLHLKRKGITCQHVVLTKEDVLLYKYAWKPDFTIPKEITYLDDNCFRNEVYFKHIEIHRSIKEIGIDCFKNCPAVIKNKSKCSITTK